MIRRGNALKRTAGVVMALGLVATACSSSSGEDGAVESDTVSTAPGDTTLGADTTPETDTSGAPGTSDVVENTQSEGGRLAAVQAAGVIKCGSNDALPGFGVIDSAGDFAGFDIDFCRAVAAGVLGDADAVEFVPLTADARFPALQSGEVDLIIRNTTWTASRDGGQGGNFLFTTFYDGQGVMVPESSGITDLEGLDNATICVLSGTTTELNLSSVFTARGIAFNPSVYDDNTTLQPAYEQGQCEAWTADASALASGKSAIESNGGETQFIIPEVISKEPLGPVVADGDTEWAQAVEWSVMATVQAWEFGLDSSSIGSYDGDDPGILTFIGQGDDVASGLGLPTDFAVQVVEQVGNYQEIYAAHIEPIGLALEGSPNNLWTEGGLMYVPPFR